MRLKILSFILGSLLLIGCGGNNDSTFEAPNEAPVLEALSLTTSNNQPINLSLASIDSDGDNITYELVSLPENGSASFDENIFVYTPNTNYSGIERFTFRAFDGSSYSDTKEIIIVVNINLNNTQPIVSDISEFIIKNNSLVKTLPAIDDDGDTLTYSLSSAPSNGSVTFENNVLVYNPNTNYYGSDSFSFVANDGIIDSNIANADITINNQNNAPFIYPDIPEGTEGTGFSYNIGVMDPDGDSFTATIEVSDSLGNVIATPAWLTIDNSTLLISSDSIDFNADPIVYIKVSATDSFGSNTTSVLTWNIVDYRPFDLTWKTDNFGDSDNNTISFYAQLNPNNVIDWGDGNIEYNLNNGILSHTYAIAGEYSVKIIGIKGFEAYGLNGGPRDSSKIVSLNSWGSSKWINMRYLFRYATTMVCNATDIPDVSGVSDMSYAFDSAYAYNCPMNDWDVSNVINMDHMFSVATSFNQPLDKWDVGNVTNMYYMFNDTVFNQDISNWDVSSVTTMGAMFNSTPFNQPLANWDVSKVTNFGSMFSASIFNQDISNWDVSSATSFSHMFISDYQFNQDLSLWNTSSATNMHNMFYNTQFNYDISSWDVSNVVLFEGMFRTTPFNFDLSSWDVSSGLDFDYMFYYSTAFDQDLSSWMPISATTMTGFLTGNTTFSTANYDLLLNAWAGLALQSNVNFGADSINYTTATSDAARTFIITNFTWNITDAGGI